MHKGSTLQVDGESREMGTIAGQGPLEPKRVTWELLDEECSIAMVARREALDREEPIVPVKSEMSGTVASKTAKKVRNTTPKSMP